MEYDSAGVWNPVLQQKARIQLETIRLSEINQIHKDKYVFFWLVVGYRTQMKMYAWNGHAQIGLLFSLCPYIWRTIVFLLSTCWTPYSVED